MRGGGGVRVRRRSYTEIDSGVSDGEFISTTLRNKWSSTWKAHEEEEKGKEGTERKRETSQKVVKQNDRKREDLVIQRERE